MGFSKEVMASKLRGKRAEADMTQQQAADAVGVSTASIVRYESGETVPAGDVVFRLAELYGCTPNDLYGLEQS